MKKTSKIEFKLEEDMYINYKSLCEREGFDMSKRLRSFIQKELQEYRETKLIKIDVLHYKPSSKLSKETIECIDFLKITHSPKIYVIETKDNLVNGLSYVFTIEKFKFSIYDILLHKETNNLKIIECRYWKEEYID